MNIPGTGQLLPISGDFAESRPFHPTILGIPESLLKDEDETTLSFKKSIGKLLLYSLITRNVEHYHMHQLAHLIVRE
jgi:hypothetical protein